MACWFAVRFADPARKPLVLGAEVARGEIVLYTNEREEAEAVLMRPPAASVDGTPEECQSRFEAVQAARRLRLIEFAYAYMDSESKKPSHADWAKCLNLLVPERGIEPPTFALRMRCSTV
jgi:hypothetical protein